MAAGESRGSKSAEAFRTIGEVSDALGVPQHVLRYWEGRFPQLRPVQRAGKRRYYRPEDVALLERIHRLLNTEGYTVKGVQQLLAKRGGAEVAPTVTAPTRAGGDVASLRRIRDMLQVALADG